MMPDYSVLVVDDDRRNRDMLGEALKQAGFEVELAASGEEAIDRLEEHDYDAVFSDIRMGACSGLDVLDVFRASTKEIPVVLITAFGSVETAILAMKRGAFDYITKPVNLDELVLIARRAVEHHRLVHDHCHRTQPVGERSATASIIGQSRRMVEVFKTVGKVARTKTAVLLNGESGTGKELIARAIHDHSPRADRPFVAVNCSAIPESLLESELFGHVKGSFTGAHTLRRGLLEEANGGTFFLDEVGDLSPAGQAKLLRVLQEGEIRRVGSNEALAVDVRVIAASRRNLRDMVNKGLFREDLLYRLNTVTITLPPLRERVEDILTLADFFLALYSTEKSTPTPTLSTKARHALASYAWPGNVRELEHVIERAVALATQSVICLDDLPPEVSDDTIVQPTRIDGMPDTLRSLQRNHVIKMLESTQGNKEHTARLLGVSRRTLYRFIDRYGLAKGSAASESSARNSAPS